jgi:hypothetical protein
MTPSARTIWGAKRKIFRGQYNIGARGQFALDFPICYKNSNYITNYQIIYSKFVEIEDFLKKR